MSGLLTISLSTCDLTSSQNTTIINGMLGDAFGAVQLDGRYGAALPTIVLIILTYVVYWLLIGSAGNPAGLPTVKGGWPPIWHANAQFSQPKGQAFLDMCDTVPNEGLIHFRGFMGQPCVLLTSAEALSEVMIRNSYFFTKPPGARKLFHRFFGQSLLVAEGDDHRYQRKLMQPSFNFAKIQGLYGMLWSTAADMNREILASLNASSNSTFTTNICDWANNAMFDAIGIAILGMDLDTLRKSSRLKELFDTATSGESSVQAVFIASALLPSWVMNLYPGSAVARIRDTGVEVRRACKALIQEARSKAEIEDRDDLLLSLIRTPEFSDGELVDQLLLIIGGGQEPTSAAFAWLIWLMAIHPEWQKRLRAEIRAKVTPDMFTNGADWDTSINLEALPILNAVCYEVLRFKPTTPITSRVAPQNTTILGKPIAHGTRIWISPYACNRLESFYGPTAKEFDPGRWINNDGKLNHHGGASSNYAFLTFLHGPRKCIGDGYAKAAIRTFAAAFIGAFEFGMVDPAKPPTPVGTLATKPKDGIWLKVRKAKA